MSTRALSFALAAAVAAVAAGTALAQDAVTPEYKWAKGDTARYRLDVQKTSKVSGVQQMEMDQTWFYVWNQEVKDVAPDGTATIDLKFESAGVHFQIPAKNMDFRFDPANPDDAKRAGSPLAIPFVGLAGESVTYKVAKNGKITDAVGFQELFQKIGDKVKAAPQGGGYVGIAMMALEDLRITQIETLFRRLPEKPLKPGEAFKTPKIREAHPAAGNLLIQSDCKLAGPEAVSGGEAWKITCETTRTPEPPAQGAAPPPGTLGEAKASTDCLILKDKGTMLRDAYTSVLAVEQKLPAPPGTPADAPPMTVTQRDEIRATLELQPAAAPGTPTPPPAEAPPAQP